MATPSRTTKIGKYDVIDVIGRGGMGVVYQARDPYLDRLVAIKMMNVDVHENTDFLERFYREAKSTASLRHPNIVTVYDLGEYQNRPFLVMEYLEGHSLESLLRAERREGQGMQRPMSLPEKIDIIVEVCQGLGYAHHHGIIHRDIKPANIMVLNDGGVKIVDFGIARLGDKTLTRTGQIVGSLPYMPPEQLRDKPVDTRADIYSTGVVLYQLLTYSLPFEGESTGSTLAKIISDDPRPFSQFGLSYPPDLEAITLKALSKNRDLRFPTAEAFAAALTEVLDGFKQASIHEYLTKAELSEQSNELEQAQEYLLKVLKLDRHHTAAAKQLSEVRGKLQAQLSAERVRQLKQQSEEALARDEFDAALGFLNQAIELDNNPDLQTLRTNIEEAKADAELVRKAISRAEAAQRSGDLDSAKSAIDSALSRRPNDSKIKVLRRAIERDLEERERHRQVELLLDEARKRMAVRKFTAALDLLLEAKKLDPSAPQLAALLERLGTEHQQEKRRRELEQLNREVQEAIDRDDFKAASARAAEALAKFPNEAALARLKELADTQIEIATQKEFVRNQIATAQQLLDSGQTQHALDAVEKALEKVPDNARLESLRTMIQDRILKERTEADKATCLRQANEAISLGRYPDAIQILESARLRFLDIQDVDKLLRFARDQQAKQRRQEVIEEAMRCGQRLLKEQNFQGAVDLLEKAVYQTPSEDLDLLLRQARDQRDSFRSDLEAAMAKGRNLLDEGAVADAREFLNSRPAFYQQFPEFRQLLEEAENTPLPATPPPDDSSEAGATLIFDPWAPQEMTPGQRSAFSTIPSVEPETVPRESEELLAERPPPPWFRNPLLLGAAVLVVALAAVAAWIVLHPKSATLILQAKAGAKVFVDGRLVGIVNQSGTISVKVDAGSHELQAMLQDYEPWSGNITLQAGERTAIVASLHPPPPQPPPLPPMPVVITGTFDLQSNVAGADVIIDGQLRGVTDRDARLELRLDPGRYRLQVRKSGYNDAPEQRIVISANKAKSVTVKLNKSFEGAAAPPTDAYFIIRSSPGAEVQIDGVSRGKVPSGGTLSLKVGPGARQVQVSLNGYESWFGKETVFAGDRKALEVPLRPRVVTAPSPPAPAPAPPPPAILVLHVPAGASVQVDNQSAFQARSAAPLEFSLVAGEHSLEVTLEGYKPWSRHQAFASGSRVELTPELAKITTQPPVVAMPAPPPSPTPVEPAPRVDDDRRIRELLNAYVAAMQDKDQVQVRHLWPTITDKLYGKMTAALRDADSIRMSLDNCKQELIMDGAAANVTCRQTLNVKARGSVQTLTNTATFALRKLKTGDWIIDKADIR
jgi:serine/threonine-protein kinase